MCFLVCVRKAPPTANHNPAMAWLSTLLIWPGPFSSNGENQLFVMHFLVLSIFAPFEIVSHISKSRLLFRIIMRDCPLCHANDEQLKCMLIHTIGHAVNCLWRMDGRPLELMPFVYALSAI